MALIPGHFKYMNNSELDIDAINKFIAETNWDEFWEKVYGCSREEIEEYRKAAAKSSFGYY